jgi:hypothetical protein
MAENRRGQTQRVSKKAFVNLPTSASISAVGGRPSTPCTMTLRQAADLEIASTLDIDGCLNAYLENAQGPGAFN